MLTRKSLIIAKWEFLEKVRKTSFLVFTLLFPVIILVLSLFPALRSDNENKADLAVIALVDFDRDFINLAEQLSPVFLSSRQSQIVFINYGKGDIKDLQDKIKSGNFNAAIINSDSLNSRMRFYRSPMLSDSIVLKLQSFMNQARSLYIQKDTSVFNNGLNNFRMITVKNETGSASLYQFYYSFSFLVLLAFLALFSGGTFVRSFLYEKSNGLVELYFSSVSGKELVTGKLLGLVLIGLLQTIIWVIIGLLVLSNSVKVNFISLPFILQLSYFILGYILYSTLFLAAGSLITNEYQAQQVTALLSVVMIFPLLTSVEIMSSPRSIVSEFLTYFPLTAAPLAIIRSGIGALNTAGIISTMIILILSIYILIAVSSRLYRASILVRTGKIKFKKIKSMLKA